MPESQRPRLGFGWKPGILTAASVLVSGIIALWLVSPLFWSSFGQAGRVFYAAARVASDGGNPYDQGQITRAQERINTELTVRGSNRGGFPPAPYQYPPLLTRFFQGLLSLDEGQFTAAVDGLFLLAGLAGLELVLVALEWRERWVPRLLFLTSMPLVTLLIAVNPTPLLLLGWGAGYLALRRGRPVLAGALLAVGLLKIPVGVPMAAAVVFASPGQRARLMLGSAVGTAAFAGINLLAGPRETLEWLTSLLPFVATIDMHQGIVMKQCCLAGFSAPFLTLGPVPAASLAVALAAAPLVWLYRRGALAGISRRDPVLLLALLLTAGLGATPYVHPYDLALLVVPLLVVASAPLTTLNRITLSLWALSLPLSVLVTLAVLPFTGTANLPWSSAVVLTAVTLLALTVEAGRGADAAVEASAPTLEAPAH